MDQPGIEALVRITARISAVFFAASLLSFAVDTRRATRPLSRFVHLFAAFVLAHTVHFAAVLWLAWASAGQNIRDRGGWIPVLIVAGLFYAAAFGVWRAWQRVADRERVSAGARRGAHAGVVLIALVFVATYAARVLSMPIFWLGVAGPSAAVALYFARGAWPAPSPEVRHEIQ